MGFRVDEEGEFVRIEVWRGADSRGLYKAWAVGGGGRYLLGAMVPEEDRLVVRRRVTISALRGCGAWPVTRCEAHMTFPFAREGRPPAGWQELGKDVSLADRVLTRAAAACGGGLIARDAHGFRLAYPYSPAAPFPLLPIFCFGELVQVGGRPRVVYHFRADGTPIFPYRQENRGDTREEVHKKGGR